ncbi:M23 family metallopeptidase [Corynebacterium breve]|uniref:M23 family metallopeptidase n=2 Tax=Corynebacterium breve TaxID=3049799 RepID=A0ABY8VDE6_9CORY|nr:M23 family metallopeptidase [Corynebacterium breve]WIM67484.1 M23 family metallopeptidase [Corynebacterium breve]
MCSNHRRSGGRHRKPGPTKGRVAVIAALASTVSTAGIGGAAAATLQDQAQPKSDVKDNLDLVNDAEAAPAEAATQIEAEEAVAPQILTINEYKPVENLSDQLTKAVEYDTERAEAAQAEANRIASEAAAAAEAEAAAAAEAAAGSSLSSVAGASSITGATVVKPAEGAFTSGYGPRWGTMHRGIDIANSVGTPILAAMAGTVIDSGPASGYGNWIRIQHDDGSMTIYGHMETLSVSVGQRVEAGQYIAGMGSRGFSTGSHLHFEYHPAGSGAVDPQPWFAAHGISL